MRLLRRAGAGLLVAMVVLFLTIGGSDDGLPETVSDDGLAPSSGRGPAYLVEIANRPNYRLVEHDLDSGVTTPRFIVPETGVIYSVGRSTDRDSVVMAYTSDYTTPGTGLYLLNRPDRRDGDGSAGGPGGEELLVPILAERPGGFFDDIAFGVDEAIVWATLEERLEYSVVGIDLTTGDIVQRVNDAVEPAVGQDWVAYLIVEPDDSRRSIGLLDLDTGSTSTIQILDGRYDLGNLVADERGDRLLFTALVPQDQSVIRLGDAAGAHGSHDGPAQWLTVDLATGEVERLVDHDPLPVRDASLLRNGELAALTDRGLVMIGDPVEMIIESRILDVIAG